MLNLLVVLQVLRQLEVLHHHQLNQQVTLVNMELLAYQVLNQFKAVVLVVLLMDHHMNQVHFHHKVVQQLVMVVH